MLSGEDKYVRDGSLGGGRHAMSLINRPLSREVLGILSSRQLTVNELLSEVPGLTQGLAYRYVKQLCEKGAAVQRPRPGAGRAMDVVLTDYGRSLVDLCHLFAHWFGLWPFSWDEMAFDSELGQLVITSKVEGWGPQILWAVEEASRTMGWLESHLGAGPDSASWGFGSAAQIRHRVHLMERTGQIEIANPGERPAVYRPTSWSYRGAGCLAYAIASELHYQPPGFRPPSLRTIAFGLVQAGHMIQADEDVSGVIQVTVPVPSNKQFVIHYAIEAGRLAAWSWGAASRPKASGSGPLMHWLGPMLGLSRQQPLVSGDVRFFNAVLAGVKQGLFAPDSAG